MDIIVYVMMQGIDILLVGKIFKLGFGPELDFDSPVELLP